MLISYFAAGFACIGLAPAAARILLPRQFSSDSDVPIVPSYNFSMPVDHFTFTDTRTYQNRFYVNDTYYQPGGPVIIYGNGESSFVPSDAALILAEYDDYTSAPIQLAKLVHGVVIGWEHRYYGQSMPVTLDENGVAVGGAKDYKYLGIEQAMEDLVYFANKFNQSTLSENKVIKSTEKLDPYNTPWIYVGGSYSGTLAAFLRIRNPEIFYASWASSAPVEARYDGTYYFNQVYRTLPSNCSTDIKAVLQSFDEIAVSGTEAQVSGFVNTAVLSDNESGLSGNEEWNPPLVGIQFIETFVYGFQYYGPAPTVQVFCDYFESFNGDAYLNSTESLDLGTIFDHRINEPFAGSVTDGGIVAAYGKDGITVAQAAYFYAMDAYSQGEGFNFSEASASVGQVTNGVSDVDEAWSLGDTPSWTWQTLSEFGFQRGYNESTNHGMQLTLNVSDNSVDRDNDIQTNFPLLDPSTIPSSPNVSAPLHYGGWKMTPSNVMFTNGELDPWRALGIMSTEEEAPNRTVVQTIPKCNEAPDGTDIFGLLYKNQVHCSDLTGYTSDSPTITKGAKLFAQAYNSWSSCFNQSRDDVRNGKAPDGKDKTNAAGRYSVGQAGIWAVIAATTIMYNLL